MSLMPVLGFSLPPGLQRTASPAQPVALFTYVHKQAGLESWPAVPVLASAFPGLPACGKLLSLVQGGRTKDILSATHKRPAFFQQPRHLRHEANVI